MNLVKFLGHLIKSAEAGQSSEPGMMNSVILLCHVLKGCKGRSNHVCSMSSQRLKLNLQFLRSLWFCIMQ